LRLIGQPGQPGRPASVFPVPVLDVVIDLPHVMISARASPSLLSRRHAVQRFDAGTGARIHPCGRLPAPAGHQGRR